MKRKLLVFIFAFSFGFCCFSQIHIKTKVEIMVAYENGVKHKPTKIYLIRTDSENDYCQSKKMKSNNSTYIFYDVPPGKYCIDLDFPDEYNIITGIWIEKIFVLDEESGKLKTITETKKYNEITVRANFNLKVDLIIREDKSIHVSGFIRGINKRFKGYDYSLIYFDVASSDFYHRLRLLANKPDLLKCIPGEKESGKTVYGSISGKITYKDSGAGIPYVVVTISGDKQEDRETTSDNDGRYLFEKVASGDYIVRFYPKHPYCYKIDPQNDPHRVYIHNGENIILNKTIVSGGAIKGKVLNITKNIPIKGINIYAEAYYFTKAEYNANEGKVKVVRYNSRSSEFNKTKADGSYFIGRLCAKIYYLIARSNIPGLADKLLTGIQVEKGEITRIDDIFFDSNDVTGIYGYIISARDGKPLKDVFVSFITVDKEKIIGRNICIGNVKTDKNGYYYIKNLEPGYYNVFTGPPIPPKKDKITGKPLYNFSESSSLFKTGKAVVNKDFLTRVDIKLDIPSYPGTNEEPERDK